ncbi:MAG: sensor histidine kinase [Rubripirellula sp.]
MAETSLDASEDVRFPLVTTRVGVIFLVVAICVLVFAFVVHSNPDQQRLHSMMWIAALATCSIGGLIAMGSARTLRTIEKELRLKKDDARQWQAVRPIVGTDPITLGWNELIQDAKAQQHDDKQRTPASLDHEVVTLARAMRGIPVAWAITDAVGAIKFLSPATCGLLDLPEEASHVGCDLLEILGLRNEQDEAAIEMAIRVLSPIRMLHEKITLSSGSLELHLRITRSRLTGRTGDSEGLAWIFNDVTQQQVATAARDDFLMTATHELRTPLSNLQAYAEALQEEEDLEIEKQKEFCNVINSEAIRLGRLVDQLLTVSQMEAGSMVISRHELAFLPMLEYAADHVRAQADQKGISITKNLSAKLPTVMGDRDKLQAALANLVGNAVKYSHNDGEVTLRCLADEHWVRIDIQDNGPGIPDAEQTKVFEKFYRGSSIRESDQRGNGLGLAFAREIAKLHGGEIELQSTAGEGCVFTMRLPVGGKSRSGV